MIENAMRGAFWMQAQLSGMPHWQLNDEEAKVLAEQTEMTLRSLGTRRAKKVQKVIDRYLPGVSLVVTALVLTVPRYQLQVRLRREYMGQRAAQAGRADGQGPPAAKPVTSEAGAVDVAPDATVTEWAETPVTGADLDELARRATEQRQ